MQVITFNTLEIKIEKFLSVNILLFYSVCVVYVMIMNARLNSKNFFKKTDFFTLFEINYLKLENQEYCQILQPKYQDGRKSLQKL